MKKIIPFIIITILLPFLVIAKPLVVTDQANYITDTSAVLWGRGAPDQDNPGLKTIGYFRYSEAEVAPIFCNEIYGTNMRYTKDIVLSQGSTSSNTSTGGVLTSGSGYAFYQKIDKLKPNTTYYYCAIVSDSKNISYGSTNSGYELVRSFRTLPCSTCDKVTIATEPAVVSNSKTSTLKGSYGSSLAVKIYFEYKRVYFGDLLSIENQSTIFTQDDFSWRETPKQNRNANTYGKYNFTVKDLQPDTTYNFRAVAEVTTGTTSQKFYGVILTFKTPSSDSLNSSGWTLQPNPPDEIEPPPGGIYPDLIDPSVLDNPGGGNDNPNDNPGGGDNPGDGNDNPNDNPGGGNNPSGGNDNPNGNNNTGGGGYVTPIYNPPNYNPSGGSGGGGAGGSSGGAGGGGGGAGGSSGGAGGFTGGFTGGSGGISTYTYGGGTITITNPSGSSGSGNGVVTGSSGGLSGGSSGGVGGGGSTTTFNGTTGTGNWVSTGTTSTGVSSGTWSGTGNNQTNGTSSGTWTGTSGNSGTWTGTWNNGVGSGTWTGNGNPGSGTTGTWNGVSGNGTGSTGVWSGTWNNGVGSGNWNGGVSNNGITGIWTGGNGKNHAIFNNTTGTGTWSLVGTNPNGGVSGTWGGLSGNQANGTSSGTWTHPNGNSGTWTGTWNNGVGTGTWTGLKTPNNTNSGTWVGKNGDGSNIFSNVNGSGSWSSTNGGLSGIWNGFSATQQNGTTSGICTSPNGKKGTWTGTWNNGVGSGTWTGCNDGNENGTWTGSDGDGSLILSGISGSGTWNSNNNGLSGTWDGFGIIANVFPDGNNNYDNLNIGSIAYPPNDAIVRWTEGVETVFARQIIKNTLLAKKYGYTPEQNLVRFAGYLAHFFAKYFFGYVDTNGREIRVSKPDVSAYELREVRGVLTVFEYYKNVIIDIRRITTEFKDKNPYEYYFRK